MNIVVDPPGDTGLGAGPDVQDSFFIGSNSHVYQLRYNGSGFIQRDLIVATGGPAAASNSSLTSFTLSSGNHAVYYIDVNHDIRELFWNNIVWTNGDLTTASGAAVHAGSGSGLASVTTTGAGHSVYYIGTDQNVYELNFNGTAWHNNNLTSAAPGGHTATIGPISAFIASSGGINVFYLDTVAHLNQLNFNLSTWSNADLISLFGGTTASVTGGLSSFIASSGGYNIYYIGATDNDMHQMNWNLSTFHDADITALAGGTHVLQTSSLSSFIASSGGINVFFTGADQKIHQLNWNLSAWVDGNLTGASGGPQAATAGGLSSFLATSGGYNVYYLAASNLHVNQITFTGTSFANTDLATASGAPAAISGSSLTSLLR